MPFNDHADTYHCEFPLRVLLVENDLEWRDQMRRKLINWGLTPVVADGHLGYEICDNAIALASDSNCHLALVDLRLNNDHDSGDVSGLELIPKLHSIDCIVVSASERLTHSILRKAKGIPEVVDSITKSEWSELSKSIEKYTKEHWNLTMRYIWPLKYDQREILNRLKTSNPKNVDRWQILINDFSDEVDVALRGLYRSNKKSPDVSQLFLKPVEHPNSVSNEMLYGRRSVVLYVESVDLRGHNRLKEVVKFAPRTHVDDEIVNYDTYVDGQLTPAYRGTIGRSSKLKDIGAICYTEVDGERFIEWYSQTNDRGLICQAIDHLFYSVLMPWWNLNSLHGFEHKNIYEHYLEVFQNLDRWIQDYRRLHGDRDRKVHINSDLPVAFQDPVLFVNNRKEIPRFRSWWSTIIHGDLHAGNVFVKSDQTTCVIDFERSGPGYFFQDFVELENSVRLRLLDLSEDQLGYAFYLDYLLQSQQRLDQLPNLAPPPGSAQDQPLMQKLHKAFDAICSIRAAAAKIGGRNKHEHMEEYYWALLMETLFSVTRPGGGDDGIPTFAQQRALLAAAVICERLERWDNSRKPWPPQEWLSYFNDPDFGKAKSWRPTPPPSKLLPLLKLQLTGLRREQNEFEVRVSNVPGREPHATGKLPYNDDELVSVMKLFEPGQYKPDDFYDYQITALRELGLLTGDALVEDWADRVGRDMYAALVPATGGVRTAFESVLAKSANGGNLQLTFDAEATALACYPWELIHDGDETDPERTEINVVRYITSKRPARGLEVPIHEQPCRVLYISARPDDEDLPQAALDRDAVKNSIDSFATPSQFVFDEIDEHTHQALKDRLELDSSPVHVLHFDEHGRFSRHCPHCGAWNYPHLLECGRCKKSLADAPAKGYLAFEGEHKKAHWVSTEDMLEGLLSSQIRLVVLSSCQSARVRYADSLFAGIGPGLILGGIPAVVAMQFSILDSHAISFHEKFYKALVQGKQITDAVHLARQRLPKPARWSPVLYLRSADGQTHLCAPK